jgi:hypothetical protein
MITRYWNRRPGKFINPRTGKKFDSITLAFDGSVREWYETLAEVLFDVQNAAIAAGAPERSTAQITCGIDTAMIFESCVLFKLPINESSKKIIPQTDKYYGKINSFKITIDRNMHPCEIRMGNVGLVKIIDQN